MNFTTFVMSLFVWMPAPLSIICCGAVVLFFFLVLLNVIAFILDIIPFL